MAESQHARDYERTVTPHHEVVPASFTDEDVERVAEALDPGAFTGPHVESEDWKNRRYEVRTKARCALSAYLEPTTKGDT